MSTSNDSYIKNSIVTKYLYVISENDMTKEEQTMIATLQGLISTKSDYQIYILSSNEPDYKIWLEDLKDNYIDKYWAYNNLWNLGLNHSTVIELLLIGLIIYPY